MVVLHVELVPGGIRASVGHMPRSKLGPDPDQKPILTCACAHEVSPSRAWLLKGVFWVRGGGGGAWEGGVLGVGWCKHHVLQWY
jgi:hypothetical protein